MQRGSDLMQYRLKMTIYSFQNGPPQLITITVASVYIENSNQCDCTVIAHRHSVNRINIYLMMENGKLRHNN